MNPERRILDAGRLLAERGWRKPRAEMDRSGFGDVIAAPA